MKIYVYYSQGDQNYRDIIETNLPSTNGFSEQIKAAYTALGVEFAGIHQVWETESTLG